MPPVHRLRHEQLVEIGIEQRPDDRIDLPVMIVNARGDISHVGHHLSSSARRSCTFPKVRRMAIFESRLQLGAGLERAQIILPKF